MNNQGNTDDQWRPRISREKRWPVFGALMLVMLLAAMDQTIVSTALPRIVGDLHGLSQYAWVATAYLLMSTITLPLYGKLSDIFGRKRILLFGVVVFLIGSALCGISQSMTELILARGFQGIGAGALMPVVVATMGDLFSPRERGRYQGLTGGVFAVASVIGPLVGGFITDNASWRWVFFVNLPLGIAALSALLVLMPSYGQHKQGVKIDFAGAALLVVALCTLLLGFNWAGTTYAWDSLPIVCLFGATAVALAGFVVRELRAPDPIVELRLFRNPIVLVSSLVTMLIGAAMFGGIFFLPLFVQDVLGRTAASSGTVMMPMMLTLVVGSFLSGMLITRSGRYKRNAVIGAAIIPVGAFLLLRLGLHSTSWDVALPMIVMGFGLGVGMSLYTTVVQNAVKPTQMGQATSTVTLFRQIGGMIGLAVFGSMMSGMTSVTAATATVRASFAGSLHTVFIGVVIVALFAMIASWFLKEIPLRHRTDDAPAPEPPL